MLVHIPMYTTTALRPAISAGDAFDVAVGLDDDGRGGAADGVGVHATAVITAATTHTARRARAKSGVDVARGFCPVTGPCPLVVIPRIARWP
jgi:hypothetical protein